MENFFGEKDSNIHSEEFERGIYKILSGKNWVMTAEEKLVVARIRKRIVVTFENGAPLSLADWAPCSWQNNTKVINYEYQPMEWLNVSSNVAERLFSRAKLVIFDHRISMLPVNLEETLFLYIN